MASARPTLENTCTSETDEETLALKKKRSRRVSFADREITSVHIFNRDEDYETPSPSAKNSNSGNDPDNDQIIAFFRDFPDVDDSKQLTPTGLPTDDDADDHVIKGRKSFFRPIESPSPGSSNVGSATSNDDEDNFFGPVSASFIRPGRLSDSAASDDNHDITMDSTAFSMHFRSLAGSESGGVGGEKTPSLVATPSDPGSFMVLTRGKKLGSESPTGVGRVISGGRDSNDMSLVGENPPTYDYGKLSPELEVLLAEGRMNLLALSVSDSASTKSMQRFEFSLIDENGNERVDQVDGGEKEVGIIDRIRMSTEEVSAVSTPSKVSVTAILDPRSSQRSPNITKNLGVSGSIDYGMQTPPIHPSKLRTPNPPDGVNSEQIKAMIDKSSPNVEWPAVTHGTSQNIYDKLPPHDARKHSTEDLVKENSFENKTHNNDTDQNSGQQDGSQATESLSSLSAKRASRKSSYVTPLPKQSGSLLTEGNMRHGGVILSIQKSNTMLDLFEPSPLANALDDGIERSKLRLSKFRSSGIASLSKVEENRKGVQGELVHAPIFNLEKHLLSDLKEECHEKLQQQMGKPEKSPGGTMLVTGFDFTSMKLKVDPIDGLPIISAPDKVVFPSSKRLDQKLQLSTEYRGSWSDDLKQLVSCDGIGLGHYSISRSDVTGESHTPTIVDNLESRGAEIEVQCNSSLEVINHFDHTSPVKMVDGRQSSFVDTQHISNTVENVQASLREINVPQLLSGSCDRNTPVETDSTYPEEGLPGERNKASPCVSASPYVCKSVNESPSKEPFTKQLAQIPVTKQLTLGPSGKETNNVSSDSNLQPSTGKGTQPPHSNSDRAGKKDSQLQLHNSLSPLSAERIDNSPRPKRRIEEQVLMDAVPVEKIRRVNRSPKDCKSEGYNSELVLECYNGSDNGRRLVGMDQWRHLSLKFSEDTKQLLCPLTNKLSTQEIGTLQDILLHLEKVKTFGMFCSQIQCQRTSDYSTVDKNQRLDEARLLLCKLVYEKARRQLMSIKHEKLQKSAQQLSDAVKVSEILKSSMSWNQSVRERDMPIDDNILNSCIVNFGTKLEVYKEKLATMRHEYEALEREIQNLTKSFHINCKMKEEPSCSETLVLLNNHLKKRTSCQLIREDLQLWGVEDFGRTDGKSSILLKYQGFVSQRFIISAVPIPSLYISNQINDVKILKNFPNMDACTAFVYVLSSRTTKKHIDSKCLRKETQITSSLLSNLLDVVEEVQLARTEIRNLVQTNFHSPSVEQLHLQLCFVDYNTSGKVTVTFDLSCLKHGVYPSEILPSYVQTSFAGSHKSFLGSLSAEINTAVGGLRVGYSRIIRICECVSQVVQSLST